MTFTLTWLGHSAFRLETAGAVLLIDPWLRGNPSFPEDAFAAATAGATHVLLSHGHDDHAATAGEICAATGAAPVGIYELVSWLGRENGVGINKGGAVALAPGLTVTLVHAVHSSSTTVEGRPIYLGGEAGFMIDSGGETLYFMGDTDVFADMALYQELHRPKYAIAPIGGHFTMDAQRAAFACKKFFDLEAAVPCHYGTFPLLASSADGFVQAMAPTRVVAPKVLEKVTL